MAIGTKPGAKNLGSLLINMLTDNERRLRIVKEMQRAAMVQSQSPSESVRFEARAIIGSCSQEWLNISADMSDIS